MRPLIGILSNLCTIENGSSIGKEKVCVQNAYVKAIEEAGGVPIVIPVNTDKENIRIQIETVNGVIISGGIDVNPILYNEDPVKELGEIHPDIDDFDIEAIKVAIELDKPLLGVCRGMQVLNVALGGSLYQDLSYAENSYIKHNQNAKSYLGTHYINIKKNTIISNILGEKALVNTYHHQSVKDLGQGLEVSAYSNDGIIEAIEKKDASFVVGVQWHPEMMAEYNGNMLNIFKYFIKKC